MSFISTLAGGESTAVEVIRSLKGQLISQVARTGKSESRAALRRSLSATARNAVSGFTYKVEPFVSQAFKDGVQRASKELKIPNDSLLNPDVAGNVQTVVDRMDSLAATIGSDVSILSGKTGELSDVILSIDAKFDEYEQRAAGIVNYEMRTVEASAKARRVTEAHKAFTEQIKNKNAPKKSLDKAAKGPHPLTIKEWKHDGSGVPRPGHLAMDGKAVVQDQSFTVRHKDGTTYHPMHPRDGVGGPQEDANCGCNDYPVVVWVTDNQEKLFRQMASESGGVSGWKGIIRGLPK